MSQPKADSPEVVARVREEMELVDIIARQVCRTVGTRVDIDDLRSAGREGLLQAARSFDPAQGVPFRRWANVRVRGAVIDAVRSMSALPRRVYEKLRAVEAGNRMGEAIAEEDAARPATTAQEAEERLTDYLAGVATAMAVGLLQTPVGPDLELRDREESAEEKLGRAELMQIVNRALEKLPEAERTLVQKHYFEGTDFDDVSKSLGLSKSWGCRLHARAMASLARELKRAGVRSL